MDLVQLMYNPETNHLHNSKLSDVEDYGYFSLGVLERDLAFKFGGKIGMKRRSIQDMKERYEKFLEKKR